MVSHKMWDLSAHNTPCKWTTDKSKVSFEKLCLIDNFVLDHVGLPHDLTVGGVGGGVVPLILPFSLGDFYSTWGSVGTGAWTWT